MSWKVLITARTLDIAGTEALKLLRDAGFHGVELTGDCGPDRGFNRCLCSSASRDEQQAERQHPRDNIHDANSNDPPQR